MSDASAFADLLAISNAAQLRCFVSIIMQTGSTGDPTVELARLRLAHANIRCERLNERIDSLTNLILGSPALPTPRDAEGRRFRQQFLEDTLIRCQMTTLRLREANAVASEANAHFMRVAFPATAEEQPHAR